MSEEKAIRESLTAVQYRVLEALIENPGESQTKIAEIAQTTRMTVWRCLQDEEFLRIYRQECKGLFSKDLVPVIDAFLAKAKEGSYLHGRTVLEIEGVYQPKKTQTAEGEDVGVESILARIWEREKAEKKAENKRLLSISSEG